MKSIRGLRLAINLAAATALSTPLLEEKAKSKGKPPEPHTPQEIKQAQNTSRYRGKPIPHPNVPSLKAVQHAGQHKNKGTSKGVPFKR